MWGPKLNFNYSSPRFLLHFFKNASSNTPPASEHWRSCGCAERDSCLEIVCSRRHFQLSSWGKEKQFHAWAAVNPSLSVPLLDALKSQSPPPPPVPSRPVIREWEREVKWGGALHAPSPTSPPPMSFAFICSRALPSAALRWNSIRHAGVATAVIFNKPLPPSITLHETTCQAYDE